MLFLGEYINHRGVPNWGENSHQEGLDEGVSLLHEYLYTSHNSGEFPHPIKQQPGWGPLSGFAQTKDNAEEVPGIFFKPATPALGLRALHDGASENRVQDTLIKDHFASAWKQRSRICHKSSKKAKMCFG